MTRLLHTICLFFLAPSLAFCQSADSTKPTSSTKENATVAGQVVRADTGEPLKKAQVSLQTRSGDKFSEFRVTDEQGHFTIDKVPAGSYSLQVSRNGFVDNECGQKKPGGSGAVLTLSSGQEITDLLFKMVRAASISGWDSLEGNEWSDAEWYDAAWLKPFETKGESIHLEESDNKSVNLTLIETKPDSLAAN